MSTIRKVASALASASSVGALLSHPARPDWCAAAAVFFGLMALIELPWEAS